MLTCSPNPSLGKILISALLLMHVSACSTIRTHKPGGEEVTMTEDEFASYLEEAFRYHNQVMSELIEFASDLREHPGRDYQALTKAEKKMIADCEPLNEVVTETLAGQTIGLKLKLELAEAVPNCRAATAAVDKLISD